MNEPWQRIRSDIVISNRWLTVEKNTYVVGGEEIPDYFIVRRSPFVLVLAETERGVILVRQYRPATEQFYWSLPGGYVDPAEDITTAAARELLEETGIRGRDFCFVGSLDPLPGYVSSRAHVVRCSATVHGGLVLGEEVEEVDVVPWSEIAKRISAGHICEMQAVAALSLALIGGKSDLPAGNAT